MGLHSFRLYVPPDIVKLLLEENREAVLGVDETEITILFSDIVDFSDITEEVPPEGVVQLLSQYLDELVKIVTAHQGLVDKFMGDGLMAFWNAPTSVKDHAAAACRAALAIQRRVAQLRGHWVSQDFPEVHTRIGINSGVCLVGNIGSPDRMSFTCLGDSVNLASRINGLNKMFHTSAMISEYVRQTVGDEFVTRPLDMVAVKGKSKVLGFSRDERSRKN